VHLPEILAYDQENHIQIGRDYGPLPSIKDYIRGHPDAIAIGKEAGEILGEFLAHLHIWGYQLLHPGSAKDGKGDPSEIDMFRNNVIGKELSSWMASGRLADVAAKYGVSGDWAEISKKSIEEIKGNNDTFNMGDFWYVREVFVASNSLLYYRTGNVLVETGNTDSGVESVKSLVVVDWEVAKTGSASTDIAQFSAEAYQLEVFTPAPSGAALLQSFLSSYTSSIETLSSTFLDSNAVVKRLLNPSRVLVHMATHVTVVGDYVSWAKEEETKKRIILRALDVCKRAFTNEVGNVDMPNIRRAWDEN
jgi:antitoxin component HigA of HigAB toxin-antitoxin module